MDTLDQSIYNNMLLSDDVKERRALARNKDYIPTDEELEVGLIDDDWLVRFLWFIRHWEIKKANKKRSVIHKADPRILARQVLAGNDTERKVNFIMFGDYDFIPLEIDRLLDHRNYQIRKAIATRENVHLEPRHIQKIMTDRHWEVRIAIPMRNDLHYDLKMLYQGLNDQSPWVRGAWHGIKKGRGLIK